MAFGSLQSPLGSSPAARLALLRCTLFALLASRAGSARLTSDTVCAGGSFSPQTGLRAWPSGSPAPPGDSSQQQANAPSGQAPCRNGFTPSNTYRCCSKAHKILRHGAAGPRRIPAGQPHAGKAAWCPRCCRWESDVRINLYVKLPDLPLSFRFLSPTLAQELGEALITFSDSPLLRRVLVVKAIPSHLVLSCPLLPKSNQNQRYCPRPQPHRGPAHQQSLLQGKITTRDRRKPIQAVGRHSGKGKKRHWKQRREAGLLHFVSLSSNSSRRPATAAQTPGACPKKAEDYDLPS